MTRLARRVLLLALLGALLSAEHAVAADAAPVPPRLAGIYAAKVPYVPSVGLYPGRYKLKFDRGATVFHYIVPGEGAVPQGVNVSGQRITFMPSGVCKSPGTYIWKIQGKILTFKKLSDQCAKRVAQLVRRWTRAG
jgi:hypothetical protein